MVALTEERLAEIEADLQSRNAFIKGLRDLADAFESRPNMPIPPYGLEIHVDMTVSEYGYVDGKYETIYNNEQTLRDLKRATRAIPGRKEKVFLDWAFQVKKDFGGQVVYKIRASRESVCKKVLTGNKTVHAASTHYTPERIVEDYEWVCEDAALLTK